MITLEDLGLANPVAPVKDDGPVVAVTDPNEPVELVAGSVEAQVTYSAWRGQPVTVVASPPGAGKSTLIARLAQRLSYYTDLRVVVATPTRQAAEAVAFRLGEMSPEGKVMLSGQPFAGVTLPNVINANDASKAIMDSVQVTVRTVASCVMGPPAVDLLLVDEAYQSTFAEVAAAGQNAGQVVLVGDPGQIGPPTTTNTDPWDKSPIAPHHRSPEGFVLRDDAMSYNLPCTYRLGQATVDAIAPLYAFAFTSARPDVDIRGFDELESILVAPSQDVADPLVMAEVADRVEELVGRKVRSSVSSPRMKPEDIAVVAARNQQTSSITAMLNARGLGEVTVGTADRLQGGQWAAVVALDPFFGSPVGSSHSASAGRLCVMASRHIAHLTWVTSRDWRQVIGQTDMAEGEADLHVAVREHLVN